jgi:hypothetical protein
MPVVASRIVERMVREHPDEAAVLASLVPSEILSVGLCGGVDYEVTGFADAVNSKLDEGSQGHQLADLTHRRMSALGRGCVKTPPELESRRDCFGVGDEALRRG